MLEPSPPAVADGPWFADDPAARGEVPAGRSVVSPVGTGDLRWDDLASTDPELAEWCADRWLGAYRRLGPVPAKLVPTRIALHRLAEQVVSPARRKANGKIGLRYTRGGFGTPFFGADVQVRVRGARARRAGREPASESRRSRRSPRLPSTSAESCFPTTSSSITSHSTSTRQQLLSLVTGTGSPPRSWKSCARRPEPTSTLRACNCGPSTSTSRSSWAAKPRVPAPRMDCPPGTTTILSRTCTSRHGSHQQPDELWQATGFSGAELPYTELLDAPDQRETALAFFDARLRALVP